MRKNLLFIFSDQHSREVLGCYGNQFAITPNLDALAKEGTVFDQAYTNSPVCVPARACMATGRYVHSTKCWDNASPYTGERFKSWGHRLLDADYSVLTIGKLHYRNDTDDIGFPDQRIPLHVKNGIGDLFGSIREENITKPSLPKYVLNAGPGESSYIDYDSDVARRSCDFLENESKELSRPWALQVGFASPHHPWVVPQEYYDLVDSMIPMPEDYKEEDWANHPAMEYRRKYRDMEKCFSDDVIRKARRTYYALCAFVDAKIGTIIESLKRSGQYENTIIVYGTDHGEMLGNRGLWFKHHFYENSAKIPLIFHGPGIKKGKRDSSIVSLVDLFPTFLGLLDVPQDQPEDQDLPGKSLVKLLQSDTCEHDRVVYGEYHGSASLEASFMVRWARYKYIYHIGLPAELFDIEQDPWERVNLCQNEKYSEVEQQGRNLLFEMVNPEDIDKEARNMQADRISSHGGSEKIIAKSMGFTVTPPPGFGTKGIH